MHLKSIDSQRMKKLLSTILLPCTLTFSIAQSVSTSPYTSYGIGELLFDNNIEQAGMAGISTVSTNPFHASANFFNPAANQNLNMTSFEFAVNTRMSQFKDVVGSSKKSSTYLSNVSLAFPVGQKVRAGIGFQPYSAIGYEVRTATIGDEVSYSNYFKGEGGLNSLHVMGSYNVATNLALGVRASYLFGDLKRSQIIQIEGQELLAEYNYTSKTNGIQFSLGANYVKRLTSNRRIEFGATYTLGTNLNAKVTDMVTTYSTFTTSQSNLDTVHYKRVHGDMKLPQMVSIGASYKKDFHWMIGAQFDWGDWGAYRLDEDDRSKMDTRLRASVGGYWIPDFNSYKSYFNRVVYRAGAFYEATPLHIANQGVKKYGVTIGFGFPVGKDRDASMLNLSLELGQQGKAESHIIKENFANIKIGFTLNDFWFRKRLID